MQFETKSSGIIKTHASGYKRDGGEKPLYDEVYFPMVKRHAELMMRGAKKYSRGNWRIASTEEDLARAKESLFRHVNQEMMGETDEDHKAAIIFACHQIALIEDKLKAKQHPAPDVFEDNKDMFTLTGYSPYMDELENAIVKAVSDTEKDINDSYTEWSDL